MRNWSTLAHAARIGYASGASPPLAICVSVDGIRLKRVVGGVAIELTVVVFVFTHQRIENACCTIRTILKLIC